jgi:DNA-binding MarR family transcriptional regulator
MQFMGSGAFSIARLTSEFAGRGLGRDGELQMVRDLNDSIRFGFLVHDVSRLRRVVIDRALKPLGITRSQWWVLAFLSRRDGMTQTALASDLDLTKVAIGGLLQRMEAAGIVVRRSDESDARIRRVFLTREGARLVGKIRRQVEDVEKEILGPNTDEELAVTVIALRRMKDTLLRKIGEDGLDAAEANAELEDAD